MNEVYTVYYTLNKVYTVYYTVNKVYTVNNMYTVYTVQTVYKVYKVYTVYTVYTVYRVYSVYTVYTVTQCLIPGAVLLSITPEASLHASSQGRAGSQTLTPAGKKGSHGPIGIGKLLKDEIR